MGCVQSGEGGAALSPEERAAQKEDSAQDKAVGSELAKDKVLDQQRHKLLLLGAGNSGKSTFFKQLCQIHGDGFSEEDRVHGARYIHDSVIHQMKSIVESAKEEHNLELGEDAQPSADFIEKLARDKSITLEIAGHIQKLWLDASIKKAFENRTNLGIVDSCPHFFDNIERIGSEDYTPTEDDILLARIPTTGIREAEFKVDENTFDLFDVGGQRSERSKWIHCFEHVSALLFVASLSCYDQNLFEEEDMNAMHEAVTLYETIINNHFFEGTSHILFLNKSDLFQEKITRVSLTKCWPDYDGLDMDFQAGVDYIREIFKSQSNASESERPIYAHITCATDKANVRKVFDDVQHGVVMRALQNNGLI